MRLKEEENISRKKSSSGYWVFSILKKMREQVILEIRFFDFIILGENWRIGMPKNF